MKCRSTYVEAGVCVCVRVQSARCVTQQSFSWTIFSSKTRWHTFRKALPPSSYHITLPVLFSSSHVLSSHPSPLVPRSLSSFLLAICLFLFHSWVKGLVETVRVFIYFFPGARWMQSQQRELNIYQEVKCSMEQRVPPSPPLDCISRYLYTKVNAEIKMTLSSSFVPLGNYLSKQETGCERV